VENHGAFNENTMGDPVYKKMKDSYWHYYKKWNHGARIA